VTQLLAEMSDFDKDCAQLNKMRQRAASCDAITCGNVAILIKIAQTIEQNAPTIEKRFKIYNYIYIIYIMGNLLVSIASIFVPLGTRKIIIPYFFHPYNTEIPWSPPSPFRLNLVSNFFNVLILMVLGTISGVMATLRYCDKYSFYIGFKHTIWLVVGFVIGNLVLVIFPMLKAPILVAVNNWLPYADYIVHGLIVSLFVLFFGAIGNELLIKAVCNKHTK
jgi:hypothetical protein